MLGVLPSLILAEIEGPWAARKNILTAFGCKWFLSLLHAEAASRGRKAVMVYELSLSEQVYYCASYWFFNSVNLLGQVFAHSELGS